MESPFRPTFSHLRVPGKRPFLPFPWIWIKLDLKHFLSIITSKKEASYFLMMSWIALSLSYSTYLLKQGRNCNNPHHPYATHINAQLPTTTHSNAQQVKTTQKKPHWSTIRTSHSGKKNNQKGPETTHNDTKRSAITPNFPKIVGKDLQGPSATHSKPRQSTLTKEIINNDSKRSNIKSTMIPI